MVSIRRLRLLGRRSVVVNFEGVQNAVTDAPVNAAGEDDDINLSPAASAPPMLLHDLNLPPTEVDDQDEGCSTPNVVVRSQTEEQNAQLTVCGSSSSQDPAAPEEVVVRRRKQYRRRGAENLESKRGVYFKNSKWQAAIKVDKKQIHLGTLNSQKEAVQLYDRAAFMRGREPNYELTEEAKKELQKLQWEDFLAMTRKAMQTNRTRKRRVKRPAAADSDQGSEEEGEQAAETLSTSDDAEAD